MDLRKSPFPTRLHGPATPSEYPTAPTLLAIEKLTTLVKIKRRSKRTQHQNSNQISYHQQDIRNI